MKRYELGTELETRSLVTLILIETAVLKYSNELRFRFRTYTPLNSQPPFSVIPDIPDIEATRAARGKERAHAQGMRQTGTKYG